MTSRAEHAQDVGRAPFFFLQISSGGCAYSARGARVPPYRRKTRTQRYDLRAADLFTASGRA